MSANDATLRERLLAEALDILGKKGGAGLTVRAVATAAGCSTMGVYTHFQGKPGLLDAIISEGFDAFDDAISQAADHHVNGRDRLRAGAVAYRDWALDHGTQYLVMFTPYVPGFTPQPATIERGDQAFHTHRARVATAVAAGDIGGQNCEIDDVALHLWSSAHGFVMLDLLRGTPRTDAVARAQFEASVEWALAGLPDD